MSISYLLKLGMSPNLQYQHSYTNIAHCTRSVEKFQVEGAGKGVVLRW